jgi:hypothetical protein
MIDFVYSASVAYVLEFGEFYIRVYYADNYVTSVVTPYAEEHLFELQYKQLGDVMRIVHPRYKPRKLSRTTATTFTLEEIDFKTGPFMDRNDLADPFNTTPTTMTCSVTAVDAYGTLTSSAGVFNVGHVGALFKLTHPRTTTTVSAVGPVDSGEIYIKGSWKFITRGTWTGTVYIMRNENGAGWETFRTYKGSSGAEQNVSLVQIENSDNVKYYIDSSTGPASATFEGDLTVENLYSSGVVKVTSYGNTTSVVVQVISRIEATTATRRWAEGSWSDYRGWPASITFFEDRCIYAGALSASDLSSGNEETYPALVGVD